MASIHKDIPLAAPADHVWDAVRDFGALHTRLVPGFVRDTTLDGEARIVSFANGTTARELLVDCDEARQRLVYAVVSERVRQHSASVQVVAEGAARCRLLWTVDVLPHEVAPYIDAQIGSRRGRDADGLRQGRSVAFAGALRPRSTVIFLTEASA